MKIQEFADKYGFDKRRVDYLTTLGFLHPHVDERNGYRDYGHQCEEEAKRIVILEAMGWDVTAKSIQKLMLYGKYEVEYVVLPMIEMERKRLEAKRETAIKYAKELTEA